CMRTRHSNYPNNSNVTIPRRRKRQVSNIVEPEIRTIVAPMAERTLEELLRAPMEGYGEAIVLPEINADHFEIKTNLLQLVQANPFNGRENENPHAHINSFKRITSTLRFRNVPNNVIKLMMFPYSLEGAAKTWYEKEPPNSILTWEDLVTKFENQFFPPSKTTHLKNEISCFTQKFKETFSEAWERFKELLRACPYHEFTESNASRMNANSSKTDKRIDKLADQLSTLVEIVSKKVVTPAPVKAVEESCVTCGGAHSWYNCPATDNNQASVCATMGTYNQVNPPNRVSNQMAPPGFAPMLRNMQNQINSLKGDLKNEIQNTIKSQQAIMMNQQTTFQNNLQNMICGLFQNQASTSGTLPSNTIPNPKGEMKAITTRSGVAYEGPSIPTNPSPKKVVERETEETTNKEQTNFQGSTAQIPPPVIPISITEPDVPKSLPKTTPIPEFDIPKLLPKPNIPYPSRRDNQKSRDKASNQMEKIFQIFQDLRFDISFADALLLMPRFAPTIKSLLMNKEKLLELAKIPLNENCLAMLLKKLPEKLGDPSKFLIPCNFPGMDVCHALDDLGASINLMPLSIWKKLSLPELTPTRITLELADRSIIYPKGLAKDVFVKVGKFYFPTDFVVVDFKADPRVPLILGRSFLRTSRALIDVIVLKDLPTEPALVCLPSLEDDNDEKEKQEVKNLAEPTAKRQTRITPCLKNFKVIQKESIFHSNKPPQVSLVFAITSTLPSIEPKDSLIMGDEHLSTFSVEEIVPIPRESEDTSRSDSKNVLPSCDDFSSINVPRDDSVTFSNPLFEFDVNFNSSDINPLFDEMLEDIECKDSYPNLDESTFLVTPLSDSNKDECLTPGDDIEFLLHHDPSTPLKSVASILEGFINDPPFEENDDLFDLECKTNDWKRILYDAPIDEAECFDPGGDNDEIEAFLAIEVPTYIEEVPVTEDISHSIIESLPTSTTLVEDSDSNREEIDIFSGPNDSIPPGIESNFDSEEDIINNLLNDDPIPEYERLTFDMEPDVPVINNVDELNEDECFDPGGGEINVEVDDSFTFITRTFLPYLTYLEVSPLLSSAENEDTIFDPGIST
ncbi:reverse transcriptase domain-containing protein, partial [Tanacetum coccineum]